MQNLRSKQSRYQGVQNTLKLQLIITLVVSVVMLMWQHEIKIFVASVTGGSIAIITTMVYIKVAFVNQQLVGDPQVVFKRHKLAMIAKLAVTILLFAISVILLKQLNFAIVLITYICVLMGGYGIKLRTLV